RIILQADPWCVVGTEQFLVEAEPQRTQERHADENEHQQRRGREQHVPKLRLIARECVPRPTRGRQALQSGASWDGHGYNLNLAFAAVAASARILTPSSTVLPWTTIACNMS